MLFNQRKDILFGRRDVVESGRFYLLFLLYLKECHFYAIV